MEVLTILPPFAGHGSGVSTPQQGSVSVLIYGAALGEQRRHEHVLFVHLHRPLRGHSTPTGREDSPGFFEAAGNQSPDLVRIR